MSEYSRRKRRRKSLRQEVSRQLRTTNTGSLKTKIEAISYSQEHYKELEISNLNTIHELLSLPGIIWINIDGTPNHDTLEKFAKIFQLHELAIEDTINVQQRAKVDEFDNHLFIVTRMATYSDIPETEQLSIFLGKNFVLTFQEQPGGDCLDPVRERLRKASGKIRKEQADYLAYAIIDAVVDGYFPILEKLGERIETLEDQIVDKPQGHTPASIHELKRDVLTIRRAIWPLREATNSLCRDSYPFISDTTRLYLRDCYDHTVRIIDLIEMFRELAHDLMDIYLSSVNNKMNEVIKVLTIITSLFIPSTFIAGIYGMNFDNQSSPWNMPELRWYFGYPFALSLMFFLTLGLMLYLQRKGYVSTNFKNHLP